MSADNWGICPKCKAMKDQEIEKHKQEVIDAYGRIPADEYLALRNYVVPELKRSLREDYEIGIAEEGEFYISYKGYCSVCLFKYEFRYDIQVYP